MKWLRAHRVVIAFAFLTLASAYAIKLNHDAIEQINQEGVGRRHQTCNISEAKQRMDVDQLRRTYRYLIDLPPSERKSTINVTILRALPLAERAAIEDDAPPFCDAPGVGEGEPDPCVPPRPVALGGKAGSPKCLNRKERQ